jgi:hypothetical protein
VSHNGGEVVSETSVDNDVRLEVRKVSRPDGSELSANLKRENLSGTH